MRVLVWGLGYVGTVVAACLAQLGHQVIGVELDAEKVKAFNEGRSPIKEPHLDNLIQWGVNAGVLSAVSEGKMYVAWADISLICVGTPSSPNGSPKLDHIRSVASEIGQGLKNCSHYHVVVLRSTVFPGLARNLLLPLLEEHSQAEAGKDFGLAMNPEFLRETSAVSDFYTPPYTVIGSLDSRSSAVVASLYRDIHAPVHQVSLEEAELLKLVNNAFHALKVGFANEVGRLCDRLNVAEQTYLNSHNIMDLVCADTKLNISSAYLKPGFAFGGSCLPKDLRSLTFNARQIGLELPILESILPSNHLHIQQARLQVHKLGVRRVTILGLCFKAGTDDFRDSPVISLIRSLWEDGIEILVYDPDLQFDETLTSNRIYLERQLPQIKQLLCTRVTEAVQNSQALIVTQKRPEFSSIIKSLKNRISVIDLVNLNVDLQQHQLAENICLDSAA